MRDERLLSNRETSGLMKIPFVLVAVVVFSFIAVIMFPIWTLIFGFLLVAALPILIKMFVVILLMRETSLVLKGQLQKSTARNAVLIIVWSYAVISLGLWIAGSVPGFGDVEIWCWALVDLGMMLFLIGSARMRKAQTNNTHNHV